MLTAYVDESKTDEKIPVVAVGGGVGTGLQWKNLLKAWRRVLLSEGVDIFHTSEFETPEGRIGTIYQDWDDPRLMAFQNAMLKAKKESQLGIAAAAAVSVDEFRSVATPQRIRRFGDEYYFCAFMLIHQVAVFATTYYPRDTRVVYYFEEGGPHQERLRRAYAMIADHEEVKRYFKFWKAPTFAPKDSQPGLQIADKLIYETAKDASHCLDDDPPLKHSFVAPSTGKRVWKTRYPSVELVTNGWDVHTRIYEAKEIEEVFRLWENDRTDKVSLDEE